MINFVTVGYDKKKKTEGMSLEKPLHTYTLRKKMDEKLLMLLCSTQKLDIIDCP